jgi:two-component system sensor histidine kinase/response regulator
VSAIGTVLVVEDTFETRKLLTDILTGEGYEVRPADSGELALASAAANPPDLILLDIRMPGLDGFEVLRRLKACEESRDIPVIFLSALTDTELRVEGIRLGAVDFISKPFQKDELLARARTHVELRQLHKSLESRVEQRTRELSQSVVDLERALRVKDAFLSNMSHELRTPLNSIIGFSAILESDSAGELSSEARKQIGFVHQSGLRLLAVVNTLLDSASIAAGTITPNTEPFELDELVRAVESAMGPLVRAKLLEFVVRAPSEPVTLVSDCGRIREILFNLVGNALKFTKQGSVTLDVTLDDGHLRFAVTDTGTGIAAEDIDTIMEPFHQLSQPGIAKTQGVGLGLAICSRFAAVLGGEITVRSELGVGSTFTLTVPTRVPDVRGGSQAARESTGSARDRRTSLLEGIS